MLHTSNCKIFGIKYEMEEEYPLLEECWDQRESSYLQNKNKNCDFEHFAPFFFKKLASQNLAPAIRPARYLYLHGGMPNYQRIKVVKAINQDPRIRLGISKSGSMYSSRVCIRYIVFQRCITMSFPTNLKVLEKFGLSGIKPATSGYPAHCSTTELPPPQWRKGFAP